jgi:hypothetical protein
MVVIFNGVVGVLLRLGVSGARPPSLAGAQAIEALTHLTGVAVWCYWAGIAGALVAAFAGGVLGARAEGRAPRKIGVRIPTTPRPHVPQPV